jgi:hypothetical protein
VDEAEGMVTRERFADASVSPPIHFAETPVLVLKMSWKYSSLQLETLQSLLEKATWHNLQGASNVRWFIKEMPTSDPALHRFLEREVLGNVKEMLRFFHPKHRCYTLGALKMARRKFSKMQQWHTDYTQHPCFPIPRHSLPFSVIITLQDECVFCYIDAFSGCKIEVIVPPFSFVRFMGYVVHCGGRNRDDKEVYRIFMYCAVTPMHIPINSFFKVVIRKKQTCACGRCFK